MSAVTPRPTPAEPEHPTEMEGKRTPEDVIAARFAAPSRLGSKGLVPGTGASPSARARARVAIAALTAAGYRIVRDDPTRTHYHRDEYNNADEGLHACVDDIHCERDDKLAVIDWSAPGEAHE